MPTFNPILLVGVDAALLVGSCVMVGISVFAVTMAVAGAVRQAAGAPVTTALGEVQRRLRREQTAIHGSSLTNSVLSALPAFTPLVRTLPVAGLKRDLGERYAAAGWPGGLTDDELFTLSMGIGVVVGAILSLATFMLMKLLGMTGVIAIGAPILALLVGLLLGPGLVSGRLDAMAKERSKEIDRMMPFVLDLLVLTIRAGAALRMAIERVTVDFQGTAIGTEFRATLADLEMGMTNKEAFQNLAKRAPIVVVQTFVDDLLQSEELGRPIADTLESLSDRVRTIRLQNAMDTAGRAKVLVLVPGTLILLACMIILFAPFIVKFYYQGSGAP